MRAQPKPSRPRKSGRSSRIPDPRAQAPRWTEEVRRLRPMLATLADAPLEDPALVYEPKYDGIRALVFVDPRPPARVTIWSRLGNEKTSQFPELVRELEAQAKSLEAPVILDGEIVALDDRGRPVGFENLQGRIHLTSSRDIDRLARSQPVAFIAFDLLRDGDEDLRPLPLTERRARLERRFTGTRTPALRLSEVAVGDGRSLYTRAAQEGSEGLIAKTASSRYETARRSLQWRKIKLVRRQEFVIGGWTEPRQTRSYFGALLLGVYENGKLRYVGHTGSGFNERELERLWRLLRRLETDVSPFTVPPKTNERPHWTRPELVAEVKFTEWTADDKLRHPIYLGLRDDVKPASVRREPTPKVGTPMARRAATSPAHARRDGASPSRKPSSRATIATDEGPASPPKKPLEIDQAIAALIARLEDLEDRRRDGVIEPAEGLRLEVTNLAKVFWPELKITKGELLRYYARISSMILPVIADRPMVLKRFPNGIHGKAFYQQRSLQEPPRGVRVERLPDALDPIGEPGAGRFVGGSLATLLYMTQMAAISEDPWFSRVQSPLAADHVAIDLDPSEGVTFRQVLDVARWIHEELETLGTPSFPKTSGSRGLHVYIPLPPETSYESGMLFCQIIATFVAGKHPRSATVERSVSARGRTVYVDYLQNILGKTLACAYSARASDYAGVSTPLSWKEVHAGIDPRDYTIRTMEDRLEAVGDLWAGLRKSKPANLRAVIRMKT